MLLAPLYRTCTEVAICWSLQPQYRYCRKAEHKAQSATVAHSECIVTFCGLGNCFCCLILCNLIYQYSVVLQGPCCLQRLFRCVQAGLIANTLHGSW
jgi:hypothetical protein